MLTFLKQKIQRLQAYLGRMWLYKGGKRWYNDRATIRVTHIDSERGFIKL